MPIDLTEAIAMHRKGDLDNAVRRYRAAIEAEPTHHQAHHLLGLIAIQQGEPGQALARFQVAITLRPDVAQYHGGLAEAYQALGQLESSVQAGREALRLNPGSWQIRCNLGSTLVQLGQLDDAIQLFREAIQLQPHDYLGYNNLGHALQLQGDTTGAVEQFRKALSLNPNSAEAHGNLGKTLLDRGSIEEALTHCREATRLRPDLAETHTRLGNVYQVLGQLDQAEACFRTAILRGPKVSAGYACLGALLEHQGDHEESLAAYREALRLEPRNPWVLAKLATRFKDKLTETDEQAIERILQWPGLVSDQRLPLLYGLAHVYDARKDYDRAAQLSIEANARQNAEFIERGLAYDPAARARDVEQLIESFTPEVFERIRGWGLPTERPVFIVGMPRSGTSLVEQILASHSRVFGAGELRLASRTFQSFLDQSGPARSLRECLDRLDQDRVIQLAQFHLAGLEALNRSSDRIIDKMPENTIFLGLMAAIFPRARVIHCRRDPRDTALSCWMTHFGQLRWSCDAGFIAAKMGESNRMIAHWREVLPIPILDVDYEDLVDHLEARSRDLVAFCGLDWEPACLDFHKTRRQVKTASVHQVRQPIYRNSIGRWRNYETPLNFLFEKL